MDGRATREVQSSQVEDPTRSVPGPAGEGIVDDGGPNENKDHAGKHAATFSDSADSEGNSVNDSLGSRQDIEAGNDIRNAGEHALENGEQEIRNLSATH